MKIENTIFSKEREILNKLVLDNSEKEVKRFFSLDGQMYKAGELDEKTKEMLGLAASMVLRCDDCIKYHIIRCYELGVSFQQLQEIFGVSLIVGGSIVIPHLRRAYKFVEDLDSDYLSRKPLSDKFQRAFQETKKILDLRFSFEDKLYLLCKYLKNEFEYYDWVGFYFVDPETEKELVLGPYIGNPTEHTRIPFGSGICGQAAEKGISFIIQDVSLETNYLSCGSNVKSEILSPIFKEGLVFGEIDIDSHSLSPFSAEDKEFLERICEEISKLL